MILSEYINAGLIALEEAMPDRVCVQCGETETACDEEDIGFRVVEHYGGTDAYCDPCIEESNHVGPTIVVCEFCDNGYVAPKGHDCE